MINYNIYGIIIKNMDIRYVYKLAQLDKISYTIVSQYNILNKYKKLIQNNDTKYGKVELDIFIIKYGGKIESYEQSYRLMYNICYEYGNKNELIENLSNIYKKYLPYTKEQMEIIRDVWMYPRRSYRFELFNGWAYS